MRKSKIKLSIPARGTFSWRQEPKSVTSDRGGKGATPVEGKRED